ncbi:MAG: hypothetical protein MI746_15220 [Pseudomonadales bacterium]|nr:hypothetical protein [Pseudomonadales bacterium]
MHSQHVSNKPMLLAGLFSLLILASGFAFSATPDALEPGHKEVVLKVENMT